MSGYRIALRPDDNPRFLDDVVVKGVSMFRAEMMDDTGMWMCCYLDGSDERVTFYVRATRRRGRRLALEFTVTEQPGECDGISYEEGSVG